ncbi:O-succinylbenzoate-CoA ligase [Dehalobacter sp. MCB1]|uniref:o-succinylbenzoate--CoA ligase n=1 Tax=Dehalobacter sp. MCB1 TaxID=1844756 RepID=UPI000377A274|nr:o-succinylbenzoate--CoA ligase [Dehalobacter sp. MCB1]RJE46970.1 O-succinylbenzoate-CoA ligase [Dehalobacter sp. MCB1]
MNWLRKQALEKPDKKFINDLTFRDVSERVSLLSVRLLPHVKKQKRVALLSNNSEQMVLFFLALQLLQKEVLMLNTRLTAEEIGIQVKTLDIQLVLSQDGLATVNFSQSFPAEVKTFSDVVGDDVTDDVKADAAEQDDSEACSEFDPAADYNPEQIAVIMNTSATTGEFKSVPLRWKQFAAHVKASQKSLGVTEEDNWLMILPLYHISALTILLRSLYNGTAVTLLESFREEETLNLVQEGQVNMLSVVPTMLNRIIDRIDRHCLRVVLIGGEFIPRPLVEKCMVRQIPIYKTYGMTETTSQSATFSVLQYPDKLDSVGFPLDSVEILIKNPGPDGSGEVLIQSPMVMDGYLGRETISGFFPTEDIGYLDPDGFLYILDRRKNMIISGGENIYPREIENILYAHPGIKECAVIGRKDPKWGQVPVLFAVSLLNEEEIRDYLSPRLARYKLPSEIIFLAELPRNATGKVRHKALEDMLAEGGSP